ncbi:uncharacterized protein EURHEDRAFT_381177 [Aspergillus ruber CBS 135680]|uniref:Uncharacterized protein n=1 Tax=Aspergillus ruber (strain CBS 135680) TaxID=1388766 RepID=A0A017S2Y7_ASPRC|nr:uncharacterized protein EURHEDRAFT_381177 [Aspergillus ruber CBS 135680]EYE91317.1 hypothetical protein EURHEDRAFT_381177 [Aspergillus ruber CBS 135680]
MKSGLSIAMQTQPAPAERSSEERSPNYQVEFTPKEESDIASQMSATNMVTTTATTDKIDDPSASVPDLSGSLPSTSSIASSASSSSSDLMPMPPLDFPLDLELELPLPILDSNWDLDTGMGKMNTTSGLGGIWPLDQTGFCGLDDMSVFPGQNTQFWVGEL